MIIGRDKYKRRDIEGSFTGGTSPAPSQKLKVEQGMNSANARANKASKQGSKQRNVNWKEEEKEGKENQARDMRKDRDKKANGDMIPCRQGIGRPGGSFINENLRNGCRWLTIDQQSPQSTGLLLISGPMLASSANRWRLL